MRDLTKQQFEAKLHKHGFERTIGGYVKLPNSQVSVYPRNAGARYRDQMAYLLSEAVRHGPKNS